MPAASKASGVAIAGLVIGSIVAGGAVALTLVIVIPPARRKFVGWLMG